MGLVAGAVGEEAGWEGSTELLVVGLGWPNCRYEDRQYGDSGEYMRVGLRKK